MKAPPERMIGTTVGPPPCVLVVVTVLPVHAGFDRVEVVRSGTFVIVVGVPTTVLPAESVTVMTPALVALDPVDVGMKDVIDPI